jgi:simple sugar transport system ATP-binding protein
VTAPVAAPDGHRDPAARLVAETRNVSKRFGASLALRDVSIAVPAGDSRALVGRNGAGKSTLVSIMTGVLTPDAGDVRLAGEPAPPLSQPAAWRGRVACVFQKSSVIGALTVAENLFLNDQPTIGGRLISWAKLRRQAQQVLEEWGLEVDVDRDAADLTIEQRQIVEIARALRRGTRFIILDEPTAQLEGREVARLFERIVRLQRSGVTFLYISHHLEEIYEVCRSVTVLRDGAIVANAPLGEMPKEAVVAAMVGDVARQTVRRQRARELALSSGRATPALAVRGLGVDRWVEEVSFELAAAECVGLAGLAGSGKEHVADAIAGILMPQSGAVAVAGVALRPGQIADARHKGIGYVPRDRHARGIVPQLSVAENLTLTIVEQLGRFGMVVPAERDRRARQLIDGFQIVAASPGQSVRELSGGNQQKAVMGRALASEPKVLLLLAPTQGVDIASKEALFAIVEKARSAGTAVLIVSDDLDELVVCDRVLVIFKGRLVAEFAAGWQDEALVAAIEGVGRA